MSSSDLPVSRSGILTPCVGICKLDKAGKCTGCKRTREELRNWLRGMTQDERRRIMAEELPKR